jgi:hypothetical protein
VGVHSNIDVKEYKEMLKSYDVDVVPMSNEVSESILKLVSPYIPTAHRPLVNTLVEVTLIFIWTSLSCDRK